MKLLLRNALNTFVFRVIVTGISLPAYTLVFNKLFNHLLNILLDQVFGSVPMIKAHTCSRSLSFPFTYIVHSLAS